MSTVRSASTRAIDIRCFSVWSLFCNPFAWCVVLAVCGLPGAVVATVQRFWVPAVLLALVGILAIGYRFFVLLDHPVSLGRELYFDVGIATRFVGSAFAQPTTVHRGMRMEALVFSACEAPDAFLHELAGG